jgi:hypothetical protein
MEITKISKPERNSSFELLRLILMFLIVVHHAFVHGLHLPSIGSTKVPMVIEQNHLLLFTTLECLCIPAVNVFVLMSGYFKLTPNFRKVLQMVVMLVLYTLVFSTGFYIYSGNRAMAFESLRFLSATPYWFMLYYFFLICFAPMLNSYTATVSRRRFVGLIAAMLVISCYFGFVWDDDVNSNGYTLFQFIMMYLIGRYISRFDVSLGRGKALIGYLACSLVCGLAMYLLRTTGHVEWAWKTVRYNNPMIIASAIFILLCFKTLHFHSRRLNRVAVSALAIYMFQSSVAAGYVYYRFLLKQYAAIGLGILPVIFVSAFAICVVALVGDQLQRYVNDKICDAVVSVIPRVSRLLPRRFRA